MFKAALIQPRTRKEGWLPKHSGESAWHPWVKKAVRRWSIMSGLNNYKAFLAFLLNGKDGSGIRLGCGSFV